MKIDFDAVSKGYSEELNKEAGVPAFLENYWDKVNPDWRTPGSTPVGKSYMLGTVPIQIPDAVGTWRRAQSTPELGDTTKKVMALPGKIMDVGTAAKEVVTGPSKPGQPGTAANVVSGVGSGLDRTKTILQHLGQANREHRGFDYLVKGTKNFLNRHIGPGGVGGIVPSLVNKAQETWKGLGDLGQAALPLGGAALAYYLMNRRKQQQQAQQQPININIGGRPIHPMFEQRGVAAFGQDKFGQLKQANIVVDSLANAVRTRMANKVIDKVVAPDSQEERPSEHSEKEIELTSKYPEMRKLLEDKQNKAYLERLLKE